MNTSEADRRIRSLRGPKPAVDPWTAHGSVLEPERRPDGRIEQTLTIFLAGAECPFTCAFCDLWRFTIDGPTPEGALPRQIEDALRAHEGTRIDRVKLYNASNFFDVRAVPRDDVPRIAELCAPLAGVTVESHVNTIGPRVLEFARALAGRLEIAVGLETIHPVAVRHLNKRLDLARFDEAARWLAAHDVDLRAFVLLGAPYVPAAECVDWTVRAVQHAVTAGAALVSIIPVRGGNGEMERLAMLGQFTPPTLRQLEAALEQCMSLGESVVTADLWDIDRLAACDDCCGVRVERLWRMNSSGRAEPPVRCSTCTS